MIKELRLKVARYFRHRYVVRTDARVRGQHYQQLMDAEKQRLAPMITEALAKGDAHVVSYDVFVRKS